jgi:uncharacterized protein YbaP (TraB family)
MMRLIFTVRQIVMAALLLTTFFSVPAQQKEVKKYPALLWEITGNGLKKPSYLFGTMHVSSKMVFHLSDSFYLGIKNADVVALELDPQLWQEQLFRYQKMQNNLRFYTQGAPGDYITEKSFQLEKYEDKLKSALSEEPTVINGLLYRTFQPSADFEEDTYLDLYIYQTGKKLGKQATGVENYFETERLILEASQDMMKDKKKRSYDTDGEGMYDIEKKTQDAYRKGDLDLLDSLEKIMQSSEAYMEKFLYRRNEIQANSIDSIVKRHSLFVGVGAAHLPGKRGVIELLRKKGYILRPIIMQDRDALQRDDIEKVKVPVTFSSFTADDELFSVSLPGKLYKRVDSRSNESWQYADMSNGAYYMVTRVKTHAGFLGQSQDLVLKKVDSLLYENIPGKILKKSPIIRNGFKGFDITNKTRRGDIQRYNILVTPFEVLVFKMSGNNNYVEGKEAEQFFSSVQIRSSTHTTTPWANFQPSRGGFSIKFPQTPFESRDNSNYDGITCWQYEAVDSTNGDAFLVFKKNIQNYHFIEEDSFLLNLAEESFGLSDYVNRQINREQHAYKGFPCLDAQYLLKDGSFVRTRFILDGPHYYLLAAQSKSRNRVFNNFFDSFSFAPNNYGRFTNYTDTLVNINVSTPVVPDIDANMRNLMERTGGSDYLSTETGYNNYWPASKMALFQDDSTGEAVYVSVQSYPKYYYPKDSAAFWKEEINEKRLKESFIIYSRQAVHSGDSISGFRYVLTDTNSTSLFSNWIFLKSNRLYRVMSMYDSLQQPDAFISRFYSSFKPLNQLEGPPIFSNKLNVFFSDLNSKDSATRQKAKKDIPNVYFGPRGFPLLIQEIGSLAYNDKDYFETKIKLINELGYINDSASVHMVVSGLQLIYEKAGDTNAFQNVVFKALARHKTKEAYGLLKELLVQDPPVFDNASEYNYLFQDIGDSLQLAKTLFPELLQLSSIDDYKENIHSLLTTLVDSGYLKAADYESSFSKLYFEAKIQLKKQLGKDEAQLQKNNEDNNTTGRYGETENNENDETSELEDYAVLLMPFYDKNPNVPKFMDKLLLSSDPAVRFKTTLLLIRNNRPVADSIIRSIAAGDRYRFELYKQLKEIKRSNQFPKSHLSQMEIARSQLAAAHTKSDLFAIEYVDKKTVQLKDRKGWVYFFKYKPEKDDDWQMGISGMQPADLREVSENNELVRLTNKKIKPNQSEEEQFDKQLKRVLFSLHKSAASFYSDSDYYLGRNTND